jgi:phosphoesterase RecJ-like protein
MIFKTNSFKTSNVTPRTLAAASQLVGLGARREQIVHGIWRTRSIPTLKLWGRALTRLEYDKDAGLAWISLSHQDFLDAGLGAVAIEGLVDELVTYAPEAKAVAIIHESRESDAICVSLHANPPYSATELSRCFGATGNRSRTKFCLEKGIGLHDGIKIVTDSIRKIMNPATDKIGL